MPAPVDLQTCLDRFPRIHLADHPTPFEPLPRLSANLGRPVYIKRDDCLGPGLGGNKIRKLEYLLAEARNQGATKVVTFGGLQSNHARLTAAAATRLGMQAHLFYFERRPLQLEGNLLLNHLLGAHLHFIPVGGSGGMSLESTIRLVHLVAWALVGAHYFIPVGGHHWLGGLGYIRAALELDEQAKSQGISTARVIVAAGSGGTLAGLMAGCALLESPLKLQGIDVGKLWKGFPASIANLASEICARLSFPKKFEEKDVPLIENTYVGSGYGKSSPAGTAAINFLAQQEGILLDPVYTGKAFAGLIDLAQKGQIGKDEPLIFLHTGGNPALFVNGIIPP
jgi:D-cysteine desulfhydrase